MKKFLGIILVAFCVILGSIQGVWALTHRVAVSSDGARIAYDVYGQGDVALVFIHGWSCDSRYWENQIGFFSDRYQVITIDLAGHGNSSLDRMDYTMQAFGEDVKAVVDQESITKVILIGHSMGGGVIAEAALLMPDKVNALVGADTLQNVARPVTQEEMDEMLNPMKENFTEAAKSFVMGMFPENANPQLVEWVAEDMSSAPQEVAISAITNYLNSYVTGSITKTFENSNVPVFAINARLWPTDVDENRKHMKSFEVFYVEDSGHFVMQEKPQAFNQALDDVIKNILEKE